MSDLFSLVPEGQAWLDNQAMEKPSRPEDFEPSAFQGGASAFFRGAGEGALGLAQSAVGFSKRLISDPAFTDNVAPTINMFRVMFPDADKALNESYDDFGKQLSSAREYIKPDAGSQGMAAQVIHGLGQFAPAIGASVIGGPVVGAATAAGSTYEQSYQDALAKGVDEQTARTVAAEQSGFNAVGMGLPAAVGGRLATRLLSGIGINTAFGGLNRFAVGETLEENGYADMAKQYRVFDGQAILIDSVLGAAFGGAHHFAARGNSVDARADAPPTVDEGTTPPQDATVTAETAPAQESGVVPSADTSTPGVTYDSRLAELQQLAGLVLSRGDRKALTDEIYRAEYEIARIGEQRQALRDQRVGNSSSRRIRNRELAALEKRVQEIQSRIEPSRQALADSTPGGRFYDARSDLSRLEQGIIPESMRGLIPESSAKPSDIDAAHTLNEGLHYDIESAPVLHGSEASINSHVAAMDEAARQLMTGQPVNVSMQARGLDGVVRPDLLADASEQRAAMEQVYRENGIPLDQREAVSESPARMTDNSAFAGKEDTSQVSVDPDTGETISSGSYDLMAARDLAGVEPDITVAHPDTGQPVKLSELLSDLDNQIATVKNESRAYSVAASCFLRNP
ncbi:TPA: hypothetical protein QHX92_001014 [Klebsiella pneumoniae subsp. pneumoniae]|uniref:hypothetical protein n=1 Tax=Klebsiella pneumoniae TaxID=573 RepID=UPI000DD2D47E|nr:hypothetical protein [Klebsiella pneumoniae]HDS4464700.1 hypothetical protein [Klebsiella pneumoniae subsp. pneumoniae]HBV1846649.1 hypothetical protein [Klebsiella pneumoniae]HBY0206951.1 hypothetical protein [Klebsiella pneumoniae]HDS8679183.1 hypothetical protein [Klebsiella pneumoniae subsp. pneumoniae]HDS8724074.1 hypothetical protein [Klebsiella pneumoniae subsp. pneumoniae]